MGVQYPVMSMEHQYFVTESIPELEELDYRVPLIRDPIDDFYARQEKQGLLVGIYEQGCKTWGMDGIPADFSNALCPDDLDRCLDNMGRVFERMPCLTRAGIHTIINGPITYSADGMPLVGKTPGRTNAYCIGGLRAGVGEGGGHGKILAELMVHGESEWDAWCLDPRRFGEYATVEYTALKAIEEYQNEFRFHMPHEHRPAGRPARTTPLYVALSDAGARFGVVNGWERATFYPQDSEFVEPHSFRFTTLEEEIAREVEIVRTQVGLMEVSGFNRFEVSGPGAREGLDGLTCSRMPARDGKVALAYCLTERGNVLGEATLAQFSPDRIWYGSAAAAERHDFDWLNEHVPPAGVRMESLADRYTILVVAGPNARALMQTVAPRTDWSREAFPWLSVCEVTVGHSPAVAMSVSFSGEPAYELHVPCASALACYQCLMTAGEYFGIGHFGLHATESMRIEKGYKHWKADLITEFNPFESGLSRFVHLDKPAFVGKAALTTQVESPPRKLAVTLAIGGASGPAHPGDSLLLGDDVVGTVTSAAFGHRINANLALAYVVPEQAEEGTVLELLMLGERHRATVVAPCQYDQGNERVRA
jgi:dimethylglycine dehydrogenase